ncbi:hypothetical protein BJ878DRAFT_485192 [Calycina marina]|uniref:FeS cluster biogenesis domain-containing protein n=1 Tax=Calycina marina TaxID=1763456 RepID=A0A9P7ZCV2_9HELO|nr:hypothetical protein BJ878DRAFT_485192 [Calycina marina]
MASRSVAKRCTKLALPHQSSAARAFLQLAPQRPYHTAPLLDFLTPSIAYSPINSASRVPQSNSIRDFRRRFTSSQAIRQTSAILNPRQDDDGIDMTLEITPRASNRLKEIMTKDANPNLALRIQVESGGCHGFQYLMSLTTLPLPPLAPDGSIQETPPEVKPGGLDEDDTVFAAGDGSGAKVVMDGPSLELLKGSKVDFTMELIGSQFKIVDNPLATSSCGCGTSFDIKM